MGFSDADDLGDGVGAVGSGSGDALAVLDELVAGVPEAVAVEVVALAPQPAADEGRGAALDPAQAPAELGLEALQKECHSIIIYSSEQSGAVPELMNPSEILKCRKFSQDWICINFENQSANLLKGAAIIHPFGRRRNVLHFIF